MENPEFFGSRPSSQDGGLTWPYKGILLESLSIGAGFYFACIPCPIARKRPTIITERHFACRCVYYLP